MSSITGRGGARERYGGMGTDTNQLIIPANTQIPPKWHVFILRRGREEIRICSIADTSTFCNIFGDSRSFSTCTFPSPCRFPPLLVRAPEVPLPQKRSSIGEGHFTAVSSSEAMKYHGKISSSAPLLSVGSSCRCAFLLSGP